jgi:DNA-binding MarR family transcriptional regulator
VALPDTSTDRTTEAVRALARVSRVLERASGELSMAHYRVLSAVASGDERASRLAARLAVGKPAISAAVDALCHRRLLSRSGVAGDQRASCLRLTAEGASLLARVEQQMSEKLSALARRTSDPEKTLDVLVEMGSALDNGASQGPGGR